MKKPILLLNEESYIEGMRLCFEVGQAHHNCAIALEKINEYGIASSHFILAVEEYMKGVVLYYKVLGAKIKDEEFVSYFKNHSPKHQVAKSFYMRLKYYKTTTEEIRDAVSLLKKELASGKISEEDYFIKEQRTIKLKMESVWATAARNNLFEEKSEVNFWNKADDIKNSGFYVNYQNSQWLTPKNLTYEKYLTIKNTSENILEAMRVLVKNLDIEGIKKHLKRTSMDYIELYNTAPNGMKIDRIFIYEVSNLDGSGFEYRAEYVDMLDGKDRILIGIISFDSGCISFAETKDVIGVPFDAIKLLIEWIQNNIEKLEDN